MDRIWLRVCAAWIFPRYIELLDKLNRNARVSRWIRQHPAPLFDVREQLYRSLSDSIRPAPMDYLEFGVWQGASLRTWLELDPNPASRYWGFDSFEGLPEDWNGGTRKGTFATGGLPPSLDDPRVSFVKGWFQETLPRFVEQYRDLGHQQVIHLDCDLYSSTLRVLAGLDPVLQTGAVLLFDEFCNGQHEFRALEDWCSAFGRRYSVLGYTRPFALQAALRLERAP